MNPVALSMDEDLLAKLKKNMGIMMAQETDLTTDQMIVAFHVDEPPSVLLEEWVRRVAPLPELNCGYSDAIKSCSVGF